MELTLQKGYAKGGDSYISGGAGMGGAIFQHGGNLSVTGVYPFGILSSPMIASAAMTFSSVSVISNALRLIKMEL
jgi:hypothetical protein